MGTDHDKILPLYEKKGNKRKKQQNCDQTMSNGISKNKPVTLGLINRRT
jgi:hypothetical protein